MTSIQYLSEKWREKGTLPNLIYIAGTSLYQNQTEICIRIDAQIPNKILANRIQHYIKWIMYHHKVEFIPGMKDWFNICKSITTVHHMNRLKKKNYIIILTGAEKAIKKIQQPWWFLKTLRNIGIHGKFLDSIKIFLKKALQKLDIEKKFLIKKFSLKFAVGKTMVKH